MEPGASDVLTQAGTCSPRSTAFLASNPAAIITDGLEVFVQLVIAAMTTLPWLRADGTACGTCFSWRKSPTPMAVGLPPSCSHRPRLLFARLAGAAAGVDVLAADLGFINEGSACSKDSRALESGTRSCGRLGPARLGSTVARSSASSSEYCASGVFSSWNR